MLPDHVLVKKHKVTSDSFPCNGTSRQFILLIISSVKNRKIPIRKKANQIEVGIYHVLDLYETYHVHLIDEEVSSRRNQELDFSRGKEEISSSGNDEDSSRGNKDLKDSILNPYTNPEEFFKNSRKNPRQ